MADEWAAVHYAQFPIQLNNIAGDYFSKESHRLRGVQKQVRTQEFLAKRRLAHDNAVLAAWHQQLLDNDQWDEYAEILMSNVGRSTLGVNPADHWSVTEAAEHRRRALSSDHVRTQINAENARLIHELHNNQQQAITKALSATAGTSFVHTEQYMEVQETFYRDIIEIVAKAYNPDRIALDIAELAKKIAKKLAPVSDAPSAGALRESITIRRVVGGVNQNKLTFASAYELRADVPYAKYVTSGRGRPGEKGYFPGNPFLRVAAIYAANADAVVRKYHERQEAAAAKAAAAYQRGQPSADIQSAVHGESTGRGASRQDGDAFTVVQNVTATDPELEVHLRDRAYDEPGWYNKNEYRRFLKTRESQIENISVTNLPGRRAPDASKYGASFDDFGRISGIVGYDKVSTGLQKLVDQYNLKVTLDYDDVISGKTTSFARKHASRLTDRTKRSSYKSLLRRIENRVNAEYGKTFQDEARINLLGAYKDPRASHSASFKQKDLAFHKKLRRDVFSNRHTKSRVQRLKEWEEDVLDMQTQDLSLDTVDISNFDESRSRQIMANRYDVSYDED